MNIVLIIAAACITLIGLFPIILHQVYRAPRRVETTTPESLSLPFSQQYLLGPKGKRLYSWLIPGELDSCTVILVHGWGANAQMMLPLARCFHRAGMNVLLYDARNHGSDRDSFSSLPRFAEDLGCAIEWAKQRDPVRRSWCLDTRSAAAAMLAASHRADIDLVIGLSGFAHPNLVMNRHLDRPWLPKVLRPLIMNYIQWVIGYRFEEIAPMNRIRYIQCPVLLVHGTEDAVVPISDMHLIEQNACRKILFNSLRSRVPATTRLNSFSSMQPS
ncbi:MAG: alpha/beta hydrolase [Chromatiaceae bacterium]|nr:alpha/beta hydrolase [Chromatiaceae bacterium]